MKRINIKCGLIDVSDILCLNEVCGEPAVAVAVAVTVAKLCLTQFNFNFIIFFFFFL